MSGGKETLKGSMYSGIYISIILWLVLSTRKEDQISMTQLKEETQRYLPPGFILDFSPYSLSRENRGWLCHLDTYIPVNFLLLVKQKVEISVGGEKKAWKDFA